MVLKYSLFNINFLSELKPLTESIVISNGCVGEEGGVRREDGEGGRGRWRGEGEKEEEGGGGRWRGGGEEEWEEFVAVSSASEESNDSLKLEGPPLQQGILKLKPSQREQVSGRGWEGGRERGMERGMEEGEGDGGGRGGGRRKEGGGGGVGGGGVGVCMVGEG